MKKAYFILVCSLCFSSFVYGQTITEVINQMDLDSLQLTLREFSGEQTTIVNGNEVTISSRVQSNNELAADYLFQKLDKLDHLNVVNQFINGEAGRRNIIATQLGKTNPDNIYIICAHYDSVAAYCADDNASGTATVLEIARILSTQCLDNTIVYALWDEEEIGLVGAGYYANQAAANNDNILGVLNIDMMGYDGNNDNNFDIDVRDVANSLEMKDDLISILNTPEYGFSLQVNVVNPGTSASDHSRFWNQGYSAVLVGESWETDDETPYYHSSGDTYNTLNFPYYHALSKLIMGYMVTKAGLVNVTNSVSQSGNVLTALQNGASYQWINIDTGTAILGETNQSFTPVMNGSYAVEITLGSCIETSNSFDFNSLSLETFKNTEIAFYPNPVKTNLVIENIGSFEELEIELYDINGKLILQESAIKIKTTLNLSALSNGVYFLKIKTNNKLQLSKIIKD
ncbi:M28 family peptidase [Oceanihabitans sp. 2_MG-2023]|uniref:M28 family peptidase n=1 Tax=Oceanihabitans sp. 2_MG-2023 TaxID=3062661 RepID=UPI0026E2935E|nr:M28 family peptidase [Oceanihabitans sp. 2_MG-2023]MDO6595442.1 M28 family peptidase [Oceanihabitans sp. 2_MG-2023]